MSCRVLQFVAVCCSSVLQSVESFAIPKAQCVAVCCSVLQCIAVCCSVLQHRVAASCCSSVLQSDVSLAIPMVRVWRVAVCCTVK